ncbi:hypothetical protein QFC22_001745 [Naganishia vaughanmartiniae]|uniref:Uncharacterized protein n=1 Tax=Naganishia vaughanmartiniae TaxID=1424756 RepID=A0ACC2XG17_9TREE|nr:hypothetical protein QFC22_001745 [Naganishia vaughanmartiniae]
MSTLPPSQATTSTQAQRSSSSISRTTTPNNNGELSERDRRRAQNRENLRAHYGLQERRDSLGVAIGEKAGVRRQQVEGDPLDPDSPAFSPQKYYQHLITTASLPQLLKESTSLSTDVKDLNSSRHALVYNHHHQLFAAGEAISILNQKTPQLQAIVNSLQERFDEISKLVENVSFTNNQMRRGSSEEAGVSM